MCGKTISLLRDAINQHISPLKSRRGEIAFNPLRHLAGGGMLRRQQHAGILARVVDLADHQQILRNGFMSHIVG